MSWSEYKKKRDSETASSWQEYKNQRDSGIAPIVKKKTTITAPLSNTKSRIASTILNGYDKYTQIQKENEEKEKEYQSNLTKLKNAKTEAEKQELLSKLKESKASTITAPIKNIDEGTLTRLGTASVKASKDIYSDDESKRVPAQIRYTLDKTKAGVKQSIGDFFYWLQNTSAKNYEKYSNPDSDTTVMKIARKIMGEEETEEARKYYNEEIKPKYVTPSIEAAKESVANKTAQSLYDESLPSGLKLAGQVGEQVGRMLPTIAVSAIPGAGIVAGDIATFGTTYGAESNQLLSEGESLNKANTIATLKGAVEVGTEKITGGIKFRGTGALDDIVGNTIARSTKEAIGDSATKAAIKKASNFLLTKGYQVLGENAEELLSNAAGYVIDKIYLDKNTSLKDVLDDTKETIKMTTLTTITLGLLGLGGENYSNEKTVNQEILSEVEQATGKKLSDQEKVEILNSIDTVKNSIQNDIVSNQNTPTVENNTQNNTISPVIQNNTETQNVKGYHGTDATFENYDLSQFGKHDQGDFGKAIYFSKDSKTASKYGKNIKENDINLNNPLVINNEQDYQNMWHQLAQEVNKETLPEDVKSLLNDEYTSQADKDFAVYDSLSADEKSSLLQKLGYDGVIDNTYNQIAVFNTSNIKNNNKNQLTENNKASQKNVDISQDVKYNNYDNLKTGETKTIPIKELSQLYNGGGFRTEEQINSLREDIKNNGIKEPIEIYKKDDGTYGIENGNHRLQIANELGITNVPVKLVESWNNISINGEEANVKEINKEVDNNGINTNNETTDFNDVTNRDRQGMLQSDSESYDNGETTNRNVEFSTRESNNNEQTSNVEGKENSREKDQSRENTRSNEEGLYTNSEKGLDELQGESKTTNRGIKELYQEYRTNKQRAREEIKTYIDAKIQESLPVSKTKKEKFISKLMNSDVSQEEITNWIRENNTITTKTVDDNIKSIRDRINSSTFYLSKNIESELKYTYGKLPRNIKFSRTLNGTVGIDTFYQEMSEYFPETFDKSIINEGSQAVAIIEFMRNEHAVTVDSQEVLDENEIEELSNMITGYKESYNQMLDILNKEYQKEKAEIKALAPLPENKKVIAPVATKTTAQESKIMTQKDVASILTKPVDEVSEKQRLGAIIAANVFDKGAVFESLSLKHKNRELMAKWDATLSSGGKAQYAIGNARYDQDSKSKTQKQICKSLEDIKTEVGDNREDFYNYMYHQLNIDRMTLEDRFSGDTGINYERKQVIKNKPVFGDSITAEYSREKVAELEKSHPEFKEYAQDVYDYLRADKQELVKEGVISQELSDRLDEMYPHYVPISRINSKGEAIKVPLDTRRTGINSPLAKATGGSSDIRPLFETMANRTTQTYRAAARNKFGVELMNTLNNNTVTAETNIDSILNELIDNDNEDTELLKKGEKGQSPTFTVFDNGEKKTFDITLDMYEALNKQKFTALDNTIVGKTAQKISSYRRGILTEYNPVFSLTNAIKDAQDVLMNSQHAAKTYSKFPEAYIQIIKKGYWYNEYIQNGGAENSYFKDGKFESDKKKSKLLEKVSIPLEAISKVNNVIETAPRLAEYIASREKGASIDTALLDAARVTTNFKAGGDLTKALNKNGATFLNASVQGFNQQVRNFREANTKGLKGWATLAMKYAIAGVPTIALGKLLWGDDEDYEELQDYVKDNYYIVGKVGDEFIRIPKGRVAAVAQKIVSNVSKYVDSDNKLSIDTLAQSVWSDLVEDVEFAADNIAPNNPFKENIISPIMDVINNTTWYGDELVPTRLQDKPASEQYDESIDKLSIWIGKKTGISPYKINYLLDQYSGGIGDLFLPMMTNQVESGYNKWIAPLADKFTVNATMKNKYPGEFYSKIDEYNVNANSDNATDLDKLKYKYMTTASSTLSDLYKEKRAIQNEDISDKEKYEKIKELQKEINSTAEEALENVDKLKVDGDTAEAGDVKFYNKVNLSTGEKEWTKLDEDEEKKVENISLKTYAEYKNKVAEETIKQRESGDLDENGQLKNKDKISIILSSNFTTKEKQELYKNNITDNDYQYIEKANINIDQYLKFKMQEFSADKVDDGTVDGKSVSGSKKAKILNYFQTQTQGLTADQKRLMMSLNGYTLNDSDQTKLYDYVNSGKLNMTKEEKLELFGDLSGYTVYKNGTVKW